MGEKWDKFILLMWKNWVLQYRRPIQTLIEILAPVAFSILLVALRSLVDPEELDAVSYDPFCTTPNDNCNEPSISQLFDWGDSFNLKEYDLLYVPDNEEIQEVMKPFKLIFNDPIGFRDNDQMLSYYSLYTNERVFAGIDFNDGNLSAGNLSLTIRFPGELRKETSYLVQSNWLTNLIYPALQTAGPRDYGNYTGATPSYRNEGFLGIQHLLSLFISMHKANIKIPETIDSPEWIEAFQSQNQKIPFILMKRFPNAAWINDILLTPLQSFVGLIFMLSFVYTCINTVKAITTEKEKQLKEAMKIMGLPNWLHWIAWFLKSFTFLFISIVLMVVLLKVRWYTNTDYTVFTHANAFVLLIFLFFYGCATITFCFAISVFFSKANTAATMAGFAYFVCYAPYSFMQNNYDSLSLATKLMASLASNTGMAFGFQIILMYEGTGEGVQFNNIWTPNTPDDDLSLGLVMVMLAIDSVIYLVIALYVEAVFPGEYGVPQKWYFPFTSAFWCGHPVDVNEKYTEVTPNQEDFFEAEPENLKAGIKIQNLRKVFDKKVAVKGLSLNMYENQITVLLGHNGAGKSTTMSMLTGMFTPSSGLALINGCDIRTEMDSVRNSLGLCPQHNIIFDDLTVAEHLYFFSKLKGMRGKEIEEEINKYVDLLELQPKRNSKSSQLSGGMKRKLCVGMALCGDSKVVMLDEPTAGMDPSARRALWELMLKQKTGRTILLSTHFMDEADLLGDRIAIMAGGEIKCCGSSFFLKKKYGAGYHLVLDKSPRCDPAKVTALLRRYIPNIDIESIAGSELTYLMSENQSYVFEPMLKELEDHSYDLGINSYGVSLTTLEEVFMKVGADHTQEEIANGVKFAANSTDSTTPLSLPRVTGMEFLLNQLWAMTFKRVLSTIRSWVIFALHIFLPVIFLIVSIFVNRQLYSVGDLPSMHLSLNTFTDAVSLIEVADTDTISKYSTILQNLLSDSYKETTSIYEDAMNLTADRPSIFRRRYITGVFLDTLDSTDSEIFDVNFTTYFNNDPYHTPAIALGVATNTMYRKLTGCEDYCTLDVTNYPFPYSTQTNADNVAMGNSTGFQVAFNLSFGMAFVSAFYVLFIIRERASKSKHLQFVSGAKVLIFWTVNFVWDFITYTVIVIAVTVALICFQEDGFKTAEDIGILSLIFFYFGWSMLPMMYLLAFWYDIPSSGYTKLIFINIATGCVAFLIVQILVTPGLDLEYVGNGLHWVLLAIPHYSLSTGVRDSNQVYVYNMLCDNFFQSCRNLNITDELCLDLTPEMKTYCQDLNRSYFKWESPGIGRNLLYSFVSGLVFFALLLLCEFEVFAKISYFIQQQFFPKKNVAVPNEDSDVQDEKQKIKNATNSSLVHDYNIVVKDLTKYYKNHLAVNGLCLGIKKAECFGLLGINGAGKTTTFKMLTGDERISYGDAWVKGKSIKTKLKEVQKSIGYCPQFDALLDDLTARESLHMFALLRGIPRSYCGVEADRLARDFDYVQHLDKKVKELSGGNKRKLSTSIALIGDPSVVYLDEPTTGMDPATKRYLFNALCKERDRGKSIILTSHSMEECEALCTRLAVMVNGNFKCLGSTQHLKTKFAEGYTLTIKVRKPKNSAATVHASTEPIKHFVTQNFPNSVIREEYEEMLTYYVIDKNIPWSAMFGILEKGKNNPELNIEDYSLCQSSLEQVFLTFTRHQHEV